jgi:DtxR family Mn-dependent transcriptional regulator
MVKHGILKIIRNESVIFRRSDVTMATNESAENYLETILMLSKRLPVVRSVDIANELGFKKSSVSIAMKNLREKQHITVTDAGYIYLTETGKEIAEMIYERHEYLSTWLESMGVPKEIATEDACKIEHVISKESFEAIKTHVKYV